MLAMLTLGRRMRHRVAGDPLDLSALPVLKALQQHGPMRLSALAAELGLDASTISRHVRQLEDRGLIERTGDPDDGRASRVGVSEHGLSCLEQGANARRALIAQVLHDWPDEDREQLRQLLTRFHNDLTATRTLQETS